ncbi:MAG: hypothetical protein HOY75_01425 [Streptomyces sp.]|nr:hypothetical protein [Streptomyces sp.]
MTETRRRTPATPAALADPPRNHGVAFTQQERDALGLTGRLPSGVLTLDQQARRAYQQMHAQGGDLAKNVYLEQLHDRNETLYFKVLSDHLAELLPIVYDPTVGEAIEKRRPRRSRTRSTRPGRAPLCCRPSKTSASPRRSPRPPWSRRRSTREWPPPSRPMPRTPSGMPCGSPRTPPERRDDRAPLRRRSDREG